MVSFIPMAAVEAVTGRMDTGQVRVYGEVKKGYTPFSEGDVLFAKITPCMENGKIAVARGLEDGSGCGSTEFHVLRPLNGMPGELLMYYLFQGNFRKEARGHMTGTAGQLRVPARFLDEWPFPLPPLPEQRRIVSEIEKHSTRLDAAVASLHRARANLKRYRASVLRAACEGRLVPTEAELARREGRDYEPASVLLERILRGRRGRWEDQEKHRGRHREPQPPDAPGLPPLPDGWIWATIKQLSWRLQYGTSAKSTSDQVGIPVLRMGNIQDGAIDLADLKYLPENHPHVPPTLLEPGDLLFNRTNSAELVGKSTVFQVNHPRSCFASYLIRASFVEGCLADYVSTYINSEYGRRYIRSVQNQQVGQANVNGTKLARMPIPLPPFAEQRRIVAEVERNMSVIRAAGEMVQVSVKRAERLRQAILRRAFEGTLVPQDPTDEPASVLLERIRAERGQAGSNTVEARRKTGRRRKAQEVPA